METPLRDIMRRLCVLDVETTINADNPNHFGATPFDPKNRIVMAGWCHIIEFNPSIAQTTRDYADALAERWQANRLSGVHQVGLYVGHNIAFDLHHMLKGASSSEYHKILGGLFIWDTMIAEYYMSRQEHKSISLEELARLYAIPFKKNPTISESFKLGLGADKVDPAELQEYLIGDVSTTRDIFLAQHKRALEIGGPEYVEYLIDMMGARLTTMLMERNGCTIDTLTFDAYKTRIGDEAKLLEAHLEGYMERCFGSSFDGTVSIASPKQVHTIIFGGDIKICDLMDTGEVYKTGPRKGTPIMRKARNLKHVPGFTCMGLPNARYEELREINSVNDKVLKDLLALECLSITGQEFVGVLMRYRTLSKDLSTYETYEKQFFPLDDYTTPLSKAKLHPNFNHALTHTKRPSCNQPNLQNVSNKDTVEIIDEH